MRGLPGCRCHWSCRGSRGVTTLGERRDVAPRDADKPPAWESFGGESTIGDVAVDGSFADLQHPGDLCASEILSDWFDTVCQHGADGIRCVNLCQVRAKRYGVLRPRLGGLLLRSCLLVAYSDDMNTRSEKVEDSNDVDAVIGRNVDFLIWRTRQTQSSVARAMGVTPGSLSHKLNGRRPWSATEIAWAAGRFGVTVDALFRTDGVVGPEGLEPPTSSVKARQLAIVTPINKHAA